MKNPFNYFSIVTGEDFCSRDDDITALKSYIENSANVVLFSKRRYGKTTLLKELFENQLDDICSIYVDIYGITDKYELLRKLAVEIIKYYKVSDIQQTLKNLKNMFSRISFSLTINQKTAMPEIRPEFLNKDFDKLLDEVLDGFVEFLVFNDKKAVIAIDEFQDIVNITDVDLEAVLRSKIQYHTNISYIFTGSKQHMLTGMFNNNKKPFYTLAANYELKPIDSDKFFEYAKKRLDLKNLDLKEKEFEYIYELSSGETRILQKIFYEIFEKYEDVPIQKSDIEDIIHMINMQNDSVYRILCDNLTKNQITVLKIVSKKYEELLSKEVLEKFNISAQSIQSSLNALLKKELIYKNGKGYTVYDKEFEFWLSII